MRYQLSVEVKLQEIPEAPEPITLKPGEDPIAVIAGMANRMIPANPPMPFVYGAAGFDFRKTTTLSVADFNGLANVVSKFDALVHDIELDAIGTDVRP